MPQPVSRTTTSLLWQLAVILAVGLALLGGAYLLV